MTVQSQTQKVQYNGNGVTLTFQVPFYFLENSHVAVYHTDALGTDTLWVEGTQYTLAGALNPSGGVIVVNIAYVPLALEYLTIAREVPFTQPTNYVENNRFDSDVIEEDLDRSVMIDQELREMIGRCFTLPITTKITNFNLPLPVSNELLGWNSTADALVNYAFVPLVPPETLPGVANTYLRRNPGNTAFDAVNAATVAADVQSFIDIDGGSA